jgi:hypothetical protein
MNTSVYEATSQSPSVLQFRLLFASCSARSQRTVVVVLVACMFAVFYAVAAASAIILNTSLVTLEYRTHHSTR